MTQQEYEQKRRECWEEYLRIHGRAYCYTTFGYAFDRAYALGKQSEAISQEEIEKAAEKYDDQHTEKLIHDMHNDSKSWEPLQDGIRNAFLAGANFALGKQEKDADTVIQGWVGRDQDGNLSLFVGSKPYKPEGMDYWSVPHGRSLEYLNLDRALFPDLTWGSEPLEVEIIIKRKKNK